MYLEPLQHLYYLTALTNVTKNSILDVAGVVDLPLEFISFSKVFISKAHSSASDTRLNCENCEVCLMQNNYP